MRTRAVTSGSSTWHGWTGNPWGEGETREHNLLLEVAVTYQISFAHLGMVTWLKFVWKTHIGNHPLLLFWPSGLVTIPLILVRFPGLLFLSFPCLSPSASWLSIHSCSLCHVPISFSTANIHSHLPPPQHGCRQCNRHAQLLRLAQGLSKNITPYSPWSFVNPL